MPAKGPLCPYCHAEARLAPNSEIYGPKVERPANVWKCDSVGCEDVWIGVWAEDPNARPLGSMANTRLRGLRSRIHNCLRPIYENGAGRISKAQVYKDLARKMNWNGKLNVSSLDENRCLQALKLINPDFEEEIEPQPQQPPRQTWHDRDRD